MIKKIIITLVFCISLFSCGKKGDPEYKEPENNVKIQSFLIKKV
jgi:hypothetical protein